ncbi:LPS export ABC transporter periplasmic protein LptC [Salinisphaera sp.]|uniref:LPS export ABC transporter periplasmic protein LptC n=1 Tax=Salinisphaera sp. TaxID=1914330 RepID=UPI000C390D1D|nr:LPS export ABC transporter periplasmic protein LptC [Salinisphaera sp.]MAS11408.1 LPS export ABC transporter periplasmic protein LptC [Salinisphaera sp.]|tara:strand:+ start:93 stop:644 length:552 start_codon:yes stop_codon:yes gene_type:complete
MLRIVAVLLVISAVLLGIRALDTPAIGTPSEPRLETPDNSDYYMTEAVVHQMNENGGLDYRMTLAETLHFPDDSARMTDIDVHYLAGTKTYWDVTAKHGRVPPGKRDIYLYDGVKGRHPKANGNVVDITTDNAWVRPDADRIDTEAHVTAVEPGQRVEGDGMEVNLKTDKLRLLNNVQVTYTP